MTADALREAMRRRFATISMREWCALKSCNATHVSEFMRGKRGPPSDLLAALNLETRYVRKRKSATAQAIEARQGHDREDGHGAKHESAVGKADAPIGQSPPLTGQDDMHKEGDRG